MSTSPRQSDVPPAIRQTLDAVRRRIRQYVWLEGLAMLVALVGIAFWLGLAIDWLLEPSPNMRGVALVAFSLAGLYVSYRYLLRRIFVPISDTSAAVLLERRFPELKDDLLTAVDTSSDFAPYHPELMAETKRAAEKAVAPLQIRELFDRAPLGRAIAVAAILVISVMVLALWSHDAFGFYLRRIALSSELWPRRVRLEVVGFSPDAAGRRVHKLAQDDDFELLVHADARGHQIPKEVEIRYRLADGRRGRDTLVRVGQADPGRDEFQLFRYQFKRVAADMSFDIVGGDDRVRDLQLQVVDRPELLAIELECAYPAYLGRDSRRLAVTGGMRIPEGTRLVLHASSTKPLTEARIHTTKGERDATLEFGNQPKEKLFWDYGTLSDDDVLLINVRDTDGVASREPYRVSLAVVKDEVPQVAVRLAGIGSAITPDAILPVVGKVTDDYGLDRAWFEYQIDAGAVVTRPLTNQPVGAPLIDKLDTFDTRALDSTSGKREFELKPGQRLRLALKASDRYDLAPENPGSQSRAGSGPQFTLDVVTPSDLLALLERRELALRQRFEAAFEKVTDTRNLLGRVEFDDPRDADIETQPSDETPPAEFLDNEESAKPNGAAAADRALARRRLRIAGSLQNTMQMADEVAGIAEAFDDLGDELSNNRIDNPDLKTRLREQIAQPLHQIAERRMPLLASQLKSVQQHIEAPATAAPELAKSIVLADEILVEMRQVLDRMLELETYNEVVAQLRGIISDQDEINRRTKERQKDRLRGLFEN
jgi:hypothetical protein